MIEFALIIWWTFAVIVWVTLIQDSARDTKDSLLCIGLAVLWPIAVVVAIPALVYQAYIASTARILVDLKNRGVLREFEQWLKTKEKGRE